MSAALPGVTYIVTIYNKARYLDGVVRALAAQEGDFPRQYVLVDDGSTDGAADIAARIAKTLPGARFLPQRENRGPSLAVNRGLAAATMPFTQIIDGDDILAPYATKLLLRAALDSGCGAVYGRNACYGTAAELRFPAEPRGVTVTVLRGRALSRGRDRPCRRQHLHSRHRDLPARRRLRRARLRAGPVDPAAHGARGADGDRRLPHLHGAAGRSRPADEDAAAAAARPVADGAPDCCATIPNCRRVSGASCRSR